VLTVPDDRRLLGLHSTAGRVGLTATITASAMTMLDATIVNVALPRIGSDLDVDVSGLQWVVMGYLLTLASLILLGGALGDRFGRRRVFMVGTVWFAAASLLCGVAPNVEVLVAARMLQGVGGALLTPGSLALIQAGFREEDRAPAVGAWSGLGGIAGALGPFLGGWLVDGPGWRWGFLINVPLAAGVLVFGRAIPESRDEHAVKGFDISGAAVIGVGLAACTWALNEAGSSGWGEPSVLVVGAVGVVAIVAFPIIELRSPHPLVPPVLFTSSRTFTVLNVATFALYGALGVVFFLVVYQLQVVSGWNALEAGSALIPGTVMMLFGSSYSARLADRIGPRPQLVAGPFIMAVGLLLLSRIEADSSYVADVLPGAVLFGLGLVTFVAPLTSTVMAAADPDHVNVASGVNNAVARTGSLAAVAGVPLAAGLVSAVGPVEITDAYRLGMLISAALAAVAGVITLVGLRATRPTSPTLRPRICPVDGPPLEPDPSKCPPVLIGS
jgi:EmrB/QacA subfamily drug resistance transporter